MLGRLLRGMQAAASTTATACLQEAQGGRVLLVVGLSSPALRANWMCQQHPMVMLLESRSNNSSSRRAAGCGGTCYRGGTAGPALAPAQGEPTAAAPPMQQRVGIVLQHLMGIIGRGPPAARSSSLQAAPARLEAPLLLLPLLALHLLRRVVVVSAAGGLWRSCTPLRAAAALAACSRGSTTTAAPARPCVALVAAARCRGGALQATTAAAGTPWGMRAIQRPRMHRLSSR